MKTTSRMIAKTLIAGAALSASLAFMAPMADAQPFRPGPPDHGQDRGMGPGHQEMRKDELNDRIQHMRDRLDEGRRVHALSRREFDRLSGRLNGIAAEKRHDEWSGRGLSRDETFSLNSQLDRLSADIHFQATDGNGR